MGIVLFVPILDSSCENTTELSEKYSSGKQPIVVYAHDGLPSYAAHVFNIYVFPNNKCSVRPETLCRRAVTLDPVTTSFLADHNMNFNTWIKMGVPYMHQLQVKDYEVMFQFKWKKRIDMANSSSNNGNCMRGDDTRKVCLIRNEDKAFVKSTMKMISEWFADPHADKVLVLPACNSFLRRALYEEIDKTHGKSKLVLSKTGYNQGNELEIRKWEPKIYEKMQDEARDKIELDEVGSYRIMEALSNECKSRHIPLIIHNGMIDILFILSHFYSTPLPDKFEDCRTLLNRIFPFIYDTKYIADQYTNSLGVSQKPKTTKLSDLFMYFQRVNEKQDKRKDRVDEQLHSAGYDAYITGIVYNHLKHAFDTYENEINKINLWRGYNAPDRLPRHFDLNIPTNVMKRKLNK